MKRILIIFPVLVAMVACERSFDISKQLGEGVVWMTFIPSNDYDTTYFALQGTTPLIGYPEPFKTAGESISVKVNGKPITMEKDRHSVPDMQQVYATDYAFSPGDLVEASATVPGLNTVTASCEVPEYFPDYKWNARFPKSNDGNSSILLVDIDYADPHDEGGFYGAAVIQNQELDSQSASWDPETKDWVWGDVQHISSTSSLLPTSMTDLSDLTSLSSTSETPITAIPRRYNIYDTERDTYDDPFGGNLIRVQIWKDMPGYTSADGRRRMTIALSCREQPKHQERETQKDDWGNAYRVDRTYRYRVVLYCFSEGFYNYMKAQYNSNGSEFNELGLAPVSFVYTNVRGGAGVCGAYTVVSSDWVGLE